MKGAVSASGRAAPAAGAEVLARGGNAADAAVAAMCTVFGAGPVLTSPGGGGVAVVHDPARDLTESLDFFARVPGLPARRHDLAGTEFREVVIEFDAGVRQSFHIGRASVAVPGCLPGFLALHARHGRLPLAEVLAVPARILREGIAMTALQAHYHQLFRPIIEATPGLRAVFTPAGSDAIAAEGDVLAHPAWAEVLEEMGRTGEDPLTRGSLRDSLLAEFGRPHGLLTPDDLDGYACEVHPPLAVRYRGREVLLPGFPSVGGAMVAFLLALLETTDLPDDPGDPRRGLALVAAQETALRARAASPPVTGPGDLEHWTCPDHRARWLPVFEELLAAPPGGARRDPEPTPGNTSHVSAVDETGLTVAITTSFGESCGHVLPGLGLALNNFLGEDDINPLGFHAAPPGERMTTMMCPTVVRNADGAAVAFGTGGSNRIKSVIPQVVMNLVDHPMSAEDAVLYPRVHRQDGATFLEGAGLPDATIEALRRHHPDLVVLPRRHLYFGGVHLAGRDADGTFHGMGDPRRDGGLAAHPPTG